MRRAGGEVARGLPIPYRLARALADLLDTVNRRWFAGKAKLPYFMMPAKLDARFRPFTYSNAEAKRLLGWVPRVALDDALARSV